MIRYCNVSFEKTATVSAYRVVVPGLSTKESSTKMLVLTHLEPGRPGG
jgi:hypothetical protein